MRFVRFDLLSDRLLPIAGNGLIPASESADSLRGIPKLCNRDSIPHRDGEERMPAALPIREDLSVGELRALARRESKGRVAVRMFAIAHALDGVSRAEAARLAGQRCRLRAAHADRLHCRHEPVPGRLLPKPGTGRPGGARARPGRLAWIAGTGRAGQRHAGAAAALQPRTEPSRARPAVPARALFVPPVPGRLRHRRPSLL